MKKASLIWGRTLILSLIFICALGQREARAIPVFAHRFGLSCEACHTTVPHLTPFGSAFLRAGYRLPPNWETRGAFPVAVKVNVQYSSAPDPAHLPKLILDELEFLSFASISHHGSYRIEQYAVDGGFPGLTRDAWLSYTSRPTFGDNKAALIATAGQFTLPLPDDPETQRPTLNHYAIFGQTVGSNPFNLFDDRIGLDAQFGKQVSGFNVHAAGLKGHDPQSGLPTLGIDTMATAQESGKFVSFTLYRYDGRRPLGPVADHFWRQAVAANAYAGKAELDLLAQSGVDTSSDGKGLRTTSSGGFAQAIWYFSPALCAVSRYDSTYDGIAGRTESITASLVYRVRPNMRLTLEGVSGSGRTTASAAWLFAY